MEYPSQTGGGSNSQSWYFTDLNDSRLNIVPPNTVIIDPNNPNRIITGGGIERYRGDLTTTFEILTTSGYDPTKITMDHRKNKAQKYMMQPTDWTNVEVTGYFEFLETNPNSEISIFARSGKHEPGRSCEGTFYRTNINANGKVRCDMKHWHSGGYEILDNATGHIGDLEMMRIGLKFIVFNSPDFNTVNIKALVDMTGGDDLWMQVCNVIDTGDTSDRFLKCGDETTKVITWGGPIVGIEIKNFPSGGMAIDKLSVREINAFQPKVIVDPPAAPFDPEAVSPPSAPPSDDYRTDLTDDDWDDDTDYPLPPWGDPGDNPGV